MQKIDPRYFSKNAYQGLQKVQAEVGSAYHKKASSIVQGLPSYISTWGLHRLAGDAIKPRTNDTQYKSKVYEIFLQHLNSLGVIQFDLHNLKDVFAMPLQQYTQINRLAIELAREWSFWATTILGEGEEL